MQRTKAQRSESIRPPKRGRPWGESAMGTVARALEVEGNYVPYQPSTASLYAARCMPATNLP